MSQDRTYGTTKQWNLVHRMEILLGERYTGQSYPELKLFLNKYYGI